jgi:hypothetical protein
MIRKIRTPVSFAATPDVCVAIVLRPPFPGFKLRRGTGLRMSRGIVLGAALLASIFGLKVVADEVDRFGSATLNFNIPEQPLASALQAYTAISGVAVLYASGMETDRRSASVDGEYTREAALKTLLGNSGLVPRYARADAIALVDPSAPSVEDPPRSPLGKADMALDMLHVPGATNSAPDRVALADYIEAIQKDLQGALKKSGTTRDGNYRVGLDLWVDPARTIRRTEVFRSTGSPERDAAVANVLQGVVLRQPAPARTPQPVRVMIVVRSSM